MIYKSEFPVLYFMNICKRTDVYFNTYYNWKLYGSIRNAWPDIITTDSAIYKRRCDDVMCSVIDCINAHSVFKNDRDFILKDGEDYVFIRLNPGKWYAMQKSAFNTLFRHTGKTMDELPVFASYAEPMSSDNEYTVMRPIYDASNSVTLETKYARLLYPAYADNDSVYSRSFNPYRMPDWIKKYTLSLEEDLKRIYIPTDAMFIKGKFGIYSRDDILAFMGVNNNKPIIYVCKDINANTVDNVSHIIKEPDPVVLTPEEYVNLDKKQIPTIIDVEDVADKGFFNDNETSNNECINMAVDTFMNEHQLHKIEWR